MVRRLSNQISSFRMETHSSFLNYVQLTFMLHYTIHGFLLTEFLVLQASPSYVFHVTAAMKDYVLLISEKRLQQLLPPLITPLVRDGTFTILFVFCLSFCYFWLIEGYPYSSFVLLYTYGSSTKCCPGDSCCTLHRFCITEHIVSYVCVYVCGDGVCVCVCLSECVKQQGGGGGRLIF